MTVADLFPFGNILVACPATYFTTVCPFLVKVISTLHFLAREGSNASFIFFTMVMLSGGVA
jgi:hypothetical protein